MKNESDDVHPMASPQAASLLDSLDSTSTQPASQATSSNNADLPNMSVEADSDMDCDTSDILGKD